MSSTPLPSSFDGDSDFYEENRWQKLTRRLKEEPLIPLGCALTCWALYNASKSIKAGDHVRTNRMFRARIYAQGFTLVAMVAGSMYWQTDRQKRKEFDAVVAEQKAKEKNEKWIIELEARDEEAKAEKALLEARRAKARAASGSNPSASSIVDESERRRKGVLEMVEDLILSKK
ncbi:hypothetical protein BP6252_03626 [Coleophoma cylindrospora]|uniref:HIG1 domain-containing protein n=1 Tax=Coleophoma cylindrospora TaxID=1849047 RepID=A0A3D8S8T6_9HELO|nr:hypothetical protein BP6252_03626 [Coleophoma cylindrospora]